MFGLLADQGVGSIPYTPLAKGRLTRPWGEHTQRFDTDPVGQRQFQVEHLAGVDPPVPDPIQWVGQIIPYGRWAAADTDGSEEPRCRRVGTRSRRCAGSRWPRLPCSRLAPFGRSESGRYVRPVRLLEGVDLVLGEMSGRVGPTRGRSCP
jgi:hypothetical protein